MVYDKTWARSCIEFNASVMRYIANQPDLDVVVLSSLLGQYVGAEWVHNVVEQGQTKVVEATLESSASAIAATVAALRQAGKRVVWFAPPPSTGQNVAACLEREVGGKFSWGGQDGCAILRHEYQRKRASVIALLDAIESAGVPVIRLDEELCDADRCRTYIERVMIYRDQGHLSHDGAALLDQRVNWARLVAERSR